MNTYKKETKKKLLISWENAYVFREAVIALIPKLSKDFSISIILVDFFTPPKTVDTLKSMVAEGVIREYWVVPNFKNALKHHFFIKSNLKTWRQRNFDVFLSCSRVQTVERYILECVVSSNCVCVCFWWSLGYLLYKRNMFFDNRNFFSKVFQKIKDAKSLSEVFTIGKKYINKTFIPFSKAINNFCNRVLLPGLLVGKNFTLNKTEKLTQLASENDNGIFSVCDEVEAELVKGVFKKSQVHVLRYPTQGNCRCDSNGKSKKSAILLVLSGFKGWDCISADNINMIYRDIKSVLLETGAKSVHFRLHPADLGNWWRQLLKYLQDKGIDASCIGYEQPIREIMCDYLGMVGCASSVLRDGRGSCDYAFVTGFSGISKTYTLTPKKWFGKSEGIDWIKEDGTYDPAIFRRGKHIAPQRDSIEDLLVELVNK